MTVRELIEMLQKCEDKDRLVTTFEPGMGGLTEATVVWEADIDGLDRRMSYQQVRTVVVSNGNGPFIQKQGHVVLGFIPAPNPPVVHVERLCCVCGKVTEWACADCGIDSAGKKTVFICNDRKCRDKHKEVCSS